MYCIYKRVNMLAVYNVQCSGAQNCMCAIAQLSPRPRSYNDVPLDGQAMQLSLSTGRTAPSSNADYECVLPPYTDPYAHPPPPPPPPPT